MNERYGVKNIQILALKPIIIFTLAASENVCTILYPVIDVQICIKLDDRKAEYGKYFSQLTRQ